MKTFEEFSNRKIISFDFDGVLHKSIIKGTFHPIDYWDFDNLIPNYTVIEKVFEEYHKGNKIIVVSSRCNFENLIKTGISEFIKKYNLPIKDIYLTDDKPKIPLLENLGVSKHYDDNYMMINNFCGSNIEFVLVYNKDNETILKEFNSEECCSFDYYSDLSFLD